MIVYVLAGNFQSFVYINSTRPEVGGLQWSVVGELVGGQLDGLQGCERAAWGMHGVALY